MKSSHGLFFAVCLMVAGTSPLSAAGGGAGGVGIGGAAGASAGGGGHGGAVSSAGGAHSSAPAGGMHGGMISTTALNGGSRSGGFGNGFARPAGATYNTSPRYVSGGYTSTAINRPAVAQPSVGNVAYVNARPASAFPAARAHNAWTDPASVSNGRYPNGAFGFTQNQRGGDGYRNSGNFSGTVLYPNAGRGVPGDRHLQGPGYLSRLNGDGRHGGGFHRREFYGRYGNGYGFGYPGVFIGGYDPYFYGGGVGDYAGADLGGITADNDADTSAALDTASQPYNNGNAVMQSPADSDDNDGSQPQSPAPSASNVQSNNGPDSLVEAVQAELSRRGYFGGKIDAVYNDATHAAIKRFQRDQKLPASGRINEATLHALQLD